MKTVHTSLVTAAHSYTRADIPWRLEQNKHARGKTSTGKRFGWRLFHYLSGGGMRTFGRTVEQEIRMRRQNRFLIVMSVLFAAWAMLLLVG